MATSPYNDTVFILDFLGRLIFQKTASILDVGAGFGRWGFLCRCYFGHGVSLSTCANPQLRIDAVEAFPGNRSPIYDCVYDATFMGPAEDVVPTMGQYDVIICSHMIEHLDKEAGLRLLNTMLAHARKALILALPIGDWPQESFGGNPYEKHKGVWYPADFQKCGVHFKRYGHRNQRWAVVIYGISQEAKWIVKTLNHPIRQAILNLIHTGLKRRRKAAHDA